MARLGRSGRCLPPAARVATVLLLLLLAATAPASGQHTGGPVAVPGGIVIPGGVGDTHGGGGEHGGSGAHGGEHAHVDLCDQPPNPKNCLLSPVAPPCQDHACRAQLTILIFPLLALLFGIIAQPLVPLLRLPYTLLLLIMGAILGAVGCATGLGMLTRSLRQWVHLNPPTIFFFVFLAPLIFEAAYATEWHVFKRLLVPIVTLSFVVVILQVFVVAAFQLHVLRTRFWGPSWWSALMFGAMLSATDPISVTATLKSAGASELLNVLIEGESLLNDGSAFVLWEAFFANAKAVGAVDGDVESPLQIVVRVLRLSLGGVAMGLAFGLAALLILSLVYEAFEVETSVLVVTAFLGFWTAQVPATVSGVICNVASGLLLSAYARPLISPSVRDPLHHLWEYIAWVANTIVFVYAGLLVTAFTWSCSGSQHEWRDYLYIFVWFLFLQLLRFVFLALFHPLLSLRQKWFTPRHSIFVGLSGLRGAVSLILALEVAEAAELPSAVRSRVVLWTTGIVALSLLVNGLAVAPALKLLGLAEADVTRATFLARARSLMTQKSLAILDSLAIDGGSKATRWSYVRDNVLPAAWLDASSVDDYVRASMDMRGAVPGDMRRSLDLHNLNRRVSIAAERDEAADMDRKHTTRFASASPQPAGGGQGRDRDRRDGRGAAAFGGGVPLGHGSLGGGAGWGDRTPQISLDIPRRNSIASRAGRQHSTGMGATGGARGDASFMSDDSPLFLSNVGQASPRGRGGGGRSPQRAEKGHVGSQGGGGGGGDDDDDWDDNDEQYPGMSTGSRGGGGMNPVDHDMDALNQPAGVMGAIGEAWDNMRRGVARVSGAPHDAQVFGQHSRSAGRVRNWGRHGSGGSARSSLDKQPVSPLGALSPQRPFRPQSRQPAERTLSGVFREVQRIHDSRRYRDVGSELDREVRRRVLMEMLTCVRSNFNVSVVDFAALVALSEDLLHALDANEERRPYDLFEFLGRPFVGKFAMLHKAAACVQGLFGRSSIESSIAVTSVVVTAATEVLKEAWLTESPHVLAEVEHLYDSAVTFLSRLETMDAYLFSCVQTDSTIRLVFAKQEQCLAELRAGGAIDAAEFKQLASELSAVRQRYFLVIDRLRRPSRHQSAREVLRKSPFFAQISDTTFDRFVASPGRFEELAVGDVVDQRGGAFLFVCRGALRVGSASLLAHRRTQQLTNSLTRAGIPLEAQSSFIENTHAGEDAETAARHAGVMPRVSGHHRHHHHHHRGDEGRSPHGRHVHHHHRSESGDRGGGSGGSGGSGGHSGSRGSRGGSRGGSGGGSGGRGGSGGSNGNRGSGGSNGSRGSDGIGIGSPRGQPPVARRGSGDGPSSAPARALRRNISGSSSGQSPPVSRLGSDGFTSSSEEEGPRSQAARRTDPLTALDGPGAELPDEIDGIPRGTGDTRGNRDDNRSDSSYSYSTGSESFSDGSRSAGGVDYAAAEAAVRAFDDGADDDDLDARFEPFSPVQRDMPVPTSAAYARRYSLAGRTDFSTQLPMEDDAPVELGGRALGGRASLQLSTGAAIHYCLPRAHLYCGPSAMIAVEDIDPTSPRGRLLQSQATAQSAALQFCACETAGEATVFWLPVDALRNVCREVPAVRNEVSRAVARLLVLDGLVDVPPYALSHTSESVAASVTFGDNHFGPAGGGPGSMAAGGDLVARATHTLSQLPYMTMATVPPEGLTVSGPGVLLVGSVRVTAVDTTGWAGVSLSHTLDAPALLPPGALILDRMDEDREGDDDDDFSGGLDFDDGDMGQPRRRAPRRRFHRLAPVTPEVLVDVSETVEEVAAARLNRWTGPSVTVDANGRFGAFPHVDYNTIPI